MIPRMNQVYLYKGELVTVIDAVFASFPTCYVIRYQDGRQVKTDDVTAFTPAPAGMSAAEDMAAENARLRAEIAALKNASIKLIEITHEDGWLSGFIKDDDSRHIFWRRNFPEGVTQSIDSTPFNAKARKDMKPQWVKLVSMINEGLDEGFAGVMFNVIDSNE